VFESPDVYEFSGPIGGSYPLSFDPGYWTSGLSPRFDLRQQLQATLSNARFYFELFVRTQGGFLALVIVLGVVALGAGIRPARFPAEGALVVWAVCAFGLYATVFVTERYIAPFVVIFWSGLLASLTLPDAAPYRRLMMASGFTLALFVWINIAAVNLEGLSAVLGYSVSLPADGAPADDAARFSGGSSAAPPAIAGALRRQGIEAGDQIGFIGYSFSAFWARLARVRIVAEIAPRHAGRFWDASPERQAAVLEAFAVAGATAIVAEPVHGAAVPPGWQPVGDTGYLVRFLR
jgi:hypothetical protein